MSVASPQEKFCPTTTSFFFRLNKAPKKSGSYFHSPQSLEKRILQKVIKADDSGLERWPSD